MTRLRWVLVTLSVFLPYAVSPYSLGAGCNPNTQGLIDEATHLAGRAARFLDDVVNHRATEVCNMAVENIFSALMGTASRNMQAYANVRNQFVQIIDRVGRLGSGSGNIMIHCQEVVKSHPYAPAEGETPKYVHPVAMTRIAGVQHPDAPTYLFESAGGQLNYLVETHDGPEWVKGYTFVMEAGSNIMREQQQNTGSNVVWSNVVLLSALDNPKRLSSVSDWTPKESADENLNLLDFGDYPFTTILHELMHSTALDHPIEDHGMVNGEPANNIVAVINLAMANDPQATSNPETFAFLALALSMPWLKWWKNDRTDPSGQPLMDENLYQARYNVETGPDGKNLACMPSFLDQGTVRAQLKKGPFALTRS
ncbi:MAG: hypothetical protein M1840_008700 [Geoglossum simile]|nr:MAG: hypothetical protein M1840_008700 [Geoglossum simile]